MKQSKLTRNQKKEYVKKGVMLDGQLVDVYAKVRYDDECRNGHNSFIITGDVYEAGKKSDRANIMGGCIHEVIAEVFPELAPFIKWHFMSADGPLHYIANTLFHARDRTHEGKEIGEPVAFDTKFKFKNFPLTYKEAAKGFWAYLDTLPDFTEIYPVKIEYDGGGAYAFEPKWSITGFIPSDAVKQWYAAPFDTLQDAIEFLEAVRMFGYEYVKTPTKWCEEVTPNLEYARSSAIWPEATLSQLQNREALEERLPALIEAFAADVEALGMEF